MIIGAFFCDVSGKAGISFANQLGLTTQKPAITVSDSNAELLQKYTELTIEETIEALLSYMRKKRFTKEQFSHKTEDRNG